MKRPLVAGRLGLRREVERHAAFALTHHFLDFENVRPPESGVAASALPPQSKTSRNFSGGLAKFGRRFVEFVLKTKLARTNRASRE